MEFDPCARCGKPIAHVIDVGYLGPVDRTDQSCDPFVPFETVCADCEGHSVLDDLLDDQCLTLP